MSVYRTIGPTLVMIWEGMSTDVRSEILFYGKASAGHKT